MAESRRRIVGVYGSPEKPKSLGLKIVEVYAKPDLATAKKVREEGLEYVPVVWVSEAHNPSEGVVDVYGEQRLFAFNNSGRLSNPSVRRRALGRVEEVAVKLEVHALILDAMRFPSPHDGTTFFSCFCTYCREAVENLDVKFEKLRLELKNLAKNLYKYPYLETKHVTTLNTWTQVRQYVVGETLELLAEKARDYGLRLWAAIFPPSLAWLVGQNYQELAGRLEETHVMLYHKCSGAACLNHELYSYAELLGYKRHGLNSVRRALRIFTGLDIEQLDNLEDRGLEKETILEEASTAKTILGDKMVPILQLDEHGLETSKMLRGYRKIAYLA